MSGQEFITIIASNDLTGAGKRGSLPNSVGWGRYSCSMSPMPSPSPVSIVIENLPSSAPWWQAYLPAVIGLVAGLVVALVAHRLSKVRERDNWKRDKVFDLFGKISNGESAFMESVNRLQENKMPCSFEIVKPYMDFNSDYTESLRRMAIVTNNKKLEALLDEMSRSVYIVANIALGSKVYEHDSNEKRTLLSINEMKNRSRKAFFEAQEIVKTQYFGHQVAPK